MRAAAVKTSPTKTPPAIPPSVEEQIRCRAYQIYEERGKIEGHALDDWLQAEAEIMTHQVMRKAS